MASSIYHFYPISYQYTLITKNVCAMELNVSKYALLCLFYPLYCERFKSERFRLEAVGGRFLELLVRWEWEGPQVGLYFSIMSCENGIKKYICWITPIYQRHRLINISSHLLSMLTRGIREESGEGITESSTYQNWDDNVM